jgi:hypothetical protein
MRVASNLALAGLAAGVFGEHIRHQPALNGAAAAAQATPQSKQFKKRLPLADHPTVPSGTSDVEWPDAEITAAVGECVRLLTPMDVDLELSKPIRNGQCGTPAPVLLKRVAGVELSPAAVVNCRVAAKIHEWVRDVIQPVAQEVLGTSVRTLVTASAYVCRQRVGASNPRLSEHSFANALDISAFVTADGRSIDLLTRWGQTAKDRQAQARMGSLAGGDARPLSDVEVPNGSSTIEAQFLRRMHQGACGLFGTVLGPEANEAHRNHLHVDLAARTRSAVCE